MAKDLVTVASYPTAAEAETVRGFLEESGIRAWVVDVEVRTIVPVWEFAAGNVKVQVAREDAARAAEILQTRVEEAREERDAVDYGEREEGKETCLSCGASFPEYLDRCPACGLSYG